MRMNFYEYDKNKAKQNMANNLDYENCQILIKTSSRKTI